MNDCHSVLCSHLNVQTYIDGILITSTICLEKWSVCFKKGFSQGNQQRKSCVSPFTLSYLTICHIIITSHWMTAIQFSVATWRFRHILMAYWLHLLSVWKSGRFVLKRVFSQLASRQERRRTRLRAPACRHTVAHFSSSAPASLQTLPERSFKQQNTEESQWEFITNSCLCPCGQNLRATAKWVLKGNQFLLKRQRLIQISQNCPSCAGAEDLEQKWSKLEIWVHKTVVFVNTPPPTQHNVQND